MQTEGPAAEAKEVLMVHIVTDSGEDRSKVLCVLLQETESGISTRWTVPEEGIPALKDLSERLNWNDAVLHTLATGESMQWTAYDRTSGLAVRCLCNRVAPGSCVVLLHTDLTETFAQFDEQPVGIGIYERRTENSFVCLYRNREGQRLHGRSLNEGIGLTDAGYRRMHIHPDDQKAVEREVRKFARGTESVPYEYRVLHPDGAVTWVQGALTWLLPGQICKTVYFDATERKQKELEEAQKASLLDIILSTTQTKIFWKDTERRFLGANKAFLDYYGFSSVDALKGKTDEDMGWHPEASPYRDDEIHVLSEGKRTFLVPGTCIRNGELRHIEASKAPMCDSEGRIIGLVGSFEDVTDAFRHQEKIIELNNRLQINLAQEERASEAKSRFLARMSHDMRTPLTTIIGLSELASEQQGQECRETFARIGESARYLLSILTDILDIKKLEEGKIALQASIVPLTEVSGLVLDIIRPLAEKKHVQFIADFPPEHGPCTAEIDVTRTRQILLNLLNNAVKFTPSGGTVRWSCSVAEETDQAIRVVHVISDTGQGMSEAFQKRMYEPFAQEVPALGSNDGTGLGLVIVRQLVGLMGGTISCHSVQGQGTTFTVTLTHPRATASPAPSRKTGDLSGLRVLVCEDVPINAQIIARFLERKGMAADCAADGREGIRMCRERPYDVILMDLNMPVVDGYAATKAIRAFNQAIPIIALSADVYPETIRRCLEAGMNGHTEKPIIPDQLYAAIARSLNKPDPITAGPSAH